MAVSGAIPAQPLVVSPQRFQGVLPSGVQTVGFYALAIYTFFYLSRIFDLLGVNLKLTMILNIVFWMAALVSGGLIILLRSKVGLPVVLFYGCVLASFPFSVWKGGSIETMVVAARSILLMASILALSVTTAWTLRLMGVIGFSMCVAGIFSSVFGQESERGRLALASGTLADPNFYAMSLLMGLPFMWMQMSNAKSGLARLIPAAATIPIFYAVVRTGSRGGMIAMVVLFGTLFLRSSMQKRMMIGLSAIAGILLASVVFSSDVLNRYSTLFSDSVQAESFKEHQDLAAAETSAEGRKELFIRSLMLTLRNPLLGVGPGMFPVAENDYAQELGDRKGAWHETHNTYTQVSSEIGIPALCLLLAAFTTALRTMYRMSKTPAPPGREREWEPVRRGAFYLFLSMITVMSGAMFLSIGYTGVLYIMTGLCGALDSSARAEFGDWSARTAMMPVYSGGQRIPMRQHA